jgi:hypothetical protein
VTSVVGSVATSPLRDAYRSCSTPDECSHLLNSH